MAKAKQATTKAAVKKTTTAAKNTKATPEPTITVRVLKLGKKGKKKFTKLLKKALKKAAKKKVT